MKNERIKIIVADENPYIREGICRRLTDFDQILVVAEAMNAADFISKYYLYFPDVCIIDMYMDNMGMLTAIQTIRKNRDPLKILFLSDYIDDDDIINMILAKGNGMIAKHRTHYEICSAIYEIAKGNEYYDIKKKERIKELLNSTSLEQTKNNQMFFTHRELEVLEKYSQGFVSSEIGTELNISLDTVNFHKKNIMRKIGAKKINKLICFASKFFIKRSR